MKGLFQVIKKALHGLSMAFSMFLVFPIPCVWDDGARDHQLALFPLTGLVTGGLWALLFWGADRLGLPVMLRAALLTVLPIVLTGGIHADGLMDTADAVLSWRSLDERLRILKDSRVGAFAVITLSAVLLTSFASAASIEYSAGAAVLAASAPLLARTAAAIAMLTVSPLSVSSHAGGHKKLSAVFPLLLQLAAMGALWAALGIYALVFSGAVVLFSWLVMLFAVHQLKGINGDIAGSGIVTGELAGLICLVIMQSAGVVLQRGLF